MTVIINTESAQEYSFAIAKVQDDLYRAICLEVNLAGSGPDKGKAVEDLRKEIERYTKETFPLKPNVFLLDWKEHQNNGVITVKESFR